MEPGVAAAMPAVTANLAEGALLLTVRLSALRQLQILAGQVIIIVSSSSRRPLLGEASSHCVLLQPRLQRLQAGAGCSAHTSYCVAGASSAGPLHSTAAVRSCTGGLLIGVGAPAGSDRAPPACLEAVGRRFDHRCVIDDMSCIRSGDFTDRSCQAIGSQVSNCRIARVRRPVLMYS
jgi:hypothetical protein